MIRNFKALGLALMATLAFSAVAASGASASVSIFHSSAMTSNTILTGTSTTNQIFRRGSEIATVKCTHAEFEATVVSGVTSTTEIQANYTTPTCTGPLNSVVHVDFTTGRCGYHFTGTASKTAVVKLVCNEPGGSVTLTATNSDGSSLCTIHVPPQSTGGHVVFDHVLHNNITSITATATVTKIISKSVGSALCGPEYHETGIYFGYVTITGYEDNDEVENNQVKIEVT